jgi:hypothetical protein
MMTRHNIRAGGSELESAEGLLGLSGHTVCGTGNQPTEDITFSHSYLCSLLISYLRLHNFSFYAIFLDNKSVVPPLIRFQYVHLLSVSRVLILLELNYVQCLLIPTRVIYVSISTFIAIATVSFLVMSR